MKNFFISICLILYIGTAFGQISKGSFLVGGNAAFSNSKVNDDYKASLLIVSPNIGYFIKNKFAIGLKTGFTHRSSQTSYQLREDIYFLGPYLKYYLLPADKIANLFVQTEYQATFNKNFSINGFGISGGSAIFLNQNIAVEFSFGYFSTQRNISEERARIRTVQSGIGLQIHL